MKTVANILEHKGGAAWSILPDAKVHEALEVMADKGVGALVVVEDGSLCGIVSERDYARKVELFGSTSREAVVKDIMTPKVICVPPEYTVEECMALMTDKHIRHLPVLEDDELVGIVSIGDVVSAVISEQEFLIEQLERYIGGA